MRALKLLLLTVIGIFALLIIAVIVATATINPNDYKSDIEQAVSDNTNLTLTIEGDLGWSLLPLGVDVNKISANHKDGQPFTQLNQLTAQVGLLSLLKLSPQVHKIILDGLEVTLEKNEQGEASWENITKKSKAPSLGVADAQTKPEAPGEATPQIDTETSATENKLKLEVEEISITNTTIHYIDKQKKQSVSLNDFNLLANKIALGSEFPLAISFAVSNSTPQLDVSASIQSAITINEDLKRFTINKLQSEYTLSGAPFNGQTIKAAFNGDSIVADLNKDTINIDNLMLKLANLSLNTNIAVAQLSKTPSIEGNLLISDFSLKELLKTLGQPEIKTADASALKKLGFTTNISGNIKDLKLEKLAITLDETRYTGRVNYKSEGQFIGANLIGTEINVDSYLPPLAPKDKTAEAVEKAVSTTQASQPKTVFSEQAETKLLPLDTIRSLNMNIAFTQQSLIAKNLKMNNLKLLLTAKEGVISLKEASGKLYDGFFNVAATIDARTDNPKWSINKKVSNIQIMPLLQDFQDMELISGGINLDADIKTRGNTVSELRNGAKGDASFNFDKGALHGFNLTKLTCEGLAMINKDKTTKTEWPEQTNFQSMKGNLIINGNQYTNENLTAALSGIELIGKGVIDAEKLNVDYGLDLKVVGSIEDNACRVNEKVKDLAIPVRCQGSLSEDPAKLCKLDYARLKGLAAELGKKELKRKANKEVDKQLDKFLGDEESDTKKSVKKIFKGLF